MKEVIEKCPTVTAAQSFQLQHQLRRKCRPDMPLEIVLFPEAIAYKDRRRKPATLSAENLHMLVVEGRREMVTQLTTRFFTHIPSEARLVQLWISKQMPATKVLPEDWVATAEAFYFKWLRETAAIIGAPVRRSPPRQSKKKRRTSGGGFFDPDSESDHDADDAAADGEEEDAESDVVLVEVAKWKTLSSETIKPFMDRDGLLDEFKLLFSLRDQFPIHFTLFKRLASDLSHEANAESTFSLSGSLSNSNTQTDPSFLSTCVRINKNKDVFNPESATVFKAYRHKFGRVMDEDVVVSDDEQDKAVESGEESEDDSDASAGEEE